MTDNTIAAQIQAALDTLKAQLEAKGFVECTAEAVFRTSGFSPMRIEMSYRVAPGKLCQFLNTRSYSVEQELGREPTFKEMVAAARIQVAELPSPRELAIKDFVNTVERLRTEAEELGIDGDFVNPLMGIMEKLASNALPAPKG